MIIASTPLRISLFGGSTDTPAFIEKYGRGSVISFASNLRTYVTISKDTFGFNSKDNKFIVNYSRREEVRSIDDLQNELVRAVLARFPTEPITVSLTSDVFSHGSGLASSSSYLISLIKAVTIFNRQTMTDSEVCSTAYEIELTLNPYCGLQDPYGCGLGGFKRLDFRGDRTVSVEFLPIEFFREYDCHLIFTGITRQSEGVLRDVSKNVGKALPILELVDDAYQALLDNRFNDLLGLLRESWEAKKKTSDLVATNSEIAALDVALAEDDRVLAHKLCGAGNGGFFLCFTKKGSIDNRYLGSVTVALSADGIRGYTI